MRFLLTASLQKRNAFTGMPSSSLFPFDFFNTSPLLPRHLVCVCTFLLFFRRCTFFSFTSSRFPISKRVGKCSESTLFSFLFQRLDRFFLFVSSRRHNLPIPTSLSYAILSICNTYFFRSYPIPAFIYLPFTIYHSCIFSS